MHPSHYLLTTPILLLQASKLGSGQRHRSRPPHLLVLLFLHQHNHHSSHTTTAHRRHTIFNTSYPLPTTSIYLRYSAIYLYLKPFQSYQGKSILSRGHLPHCYHHHYAPSIHPFIHHPSSTLLPLTTSYSSISHDPLAHAINTSSLLFASIIPRGPLSS